LTLADVSAAKKMGPDREQTIRGLAAASVFDLTGRRIAAWHLLHLNIDQMRVSLRGRPPGAGEPVSA